MTPRMRQAMAAIEHFMSQHGVAPTMDELQSELGFSSKSGAEFLVKALERDGWISRRPRRARSIEILRHLPAAQSTDHLRQALIKITKTRSIEKARRIALEALK